MFLIAAPKPSLDVIDKHHASSRAPCESQREKESTKDRRQSGDGGKFASLQRWLKGDDVKKPDRPPVPPRYGHEI